MDPKSNITEYLGVEHPEWAPHDLHAFKLTYDVPKVGEKSEILYFCTKSLELKFATVSEFDGFVVSVPKLEARTYTDADF
jgi:hypothetical protein